MQNTFNYPVPYKWRFASTAINYLYADVFNKLKNINWMKMLCINVFAYNKTYKNGIGKVRDKIT